jgi:hypothetical protein
MKTKILVGILASHHRQKFVEEFRERLTHSVLDYKFIYGDPTTQPGCAWREPKEDELFFNISDRKEWMVLKCKALFKWALDNGYTHVWRCCDDSVIYPDRLLKLAKEGLYNYDYAGCICGYGVINKKIFWLRYLDYMHGGVGLWLSTKAMQRLLADEWKGPKSSPYPRTLSVCPDSPFTGSYDIYWDDLWIGEVLKGNLPYDSPKRNDIYANYGDIKVYDNPSLFPSYQPFNEATIVARHSLEQMGVSELDVPPFASDIGKVVKLKLDWGKGSKSVLTEIKP